MLAHFWTFLQDESNRVLGWLGGNRAVLGWLGGGVASAEQSGGGAGSGGERCSRDSPNSLALAAGIRCQCKPRRRIAMTAIGLTRALRPLRSEPSGRP